MPPSVLPAAVVADANVLLSAVIGGRAWGVLWHPHGPRCSTSDHVYAEVVSHLPRLAAKRRLEEAYLLEQLRLSPLTVVSAKTYAGREGEARQRIAHRDPDDWPTVALALALSQPIWTQDRDFEEAGVHTYTTGQLLDELREVGELP